jgi:hypothetical protein
VGVGLGGVDWGRVDREGDVKALLVVTVQMDKGPTERCELVSPTLPLTEIPYMFLICW